MGFCFVGTSQAQEYFPPPIVRLAVIGVEFECPSKGIRRGLVIALPSVH